MTEHDIDERWPVLAQVVRAIEWHADPDPESLCKSFEIELEHSPGVLNAAEAELAALSGTRIVEVIRTNPGDECAIAPNAARFLTSYFN